MHKTKFIYREKVAKKLDLYLVSKTIKKLNLIYFEDNFKL